MNPGKERKACDSTCWGEGGILEVSTATLLASKLYENMNHIILVNS